MPNTCIQSFDGDKVAVKEEVSKDVEEVFSAGHVKLGCEAGIICNIS